MGLAAGGDADQVAKDAHGGHIGTGTGALDDKRPVRIAVGGEQDDVVRAFDVEERVIGGDGGQARGGLAGLGVKAPHVLEAFTLGIGFLPLRLHGLLDLGQAVHEAVDGAFHLAVEQEPLPCHIGHLQGVSGFSGEDEDLALHVHAAQVGAGIGLGQAGSPGVFDDLLERDAAVEIGKDVVERAAEHALDLVNAVPTLHQVLDGVNQGQSRPYVGLEPVFNAHAQGRAA